MPGPTGQKYGFDPNYGGNNEHFHYGLDWPAFRFQPVAAPCDGVIVIKDTEQPMGFPDSQDGAWGLYLEIQPDDGGLPIGLAHFETLVFDVGYHVHRGEIVGGAGDSGFAFGVHVHVQLVNRTGRTPRERRPDPTPFFVAEATV